MVARAALDGMESQLGAAGVDVGAKVELSPDEVTNVSIALDSAEGLKDADVANDEKKKTEDLKVEEKLINKES